MEYFICEKEPGPNGQFRAVFGPVSTRAEAEVWQQLRINDTESRNESRVIQIFGKSELIRRFYGRSYGAVLFDVGFFRVEWERMAQTVLDLELTGEYYETLLEWYHDQK